MLSKSIRSKAEEYPHVTFAAAERRQADLTDEDFPPDMKRPNGEKKPLRTDNPAIGFFCFCFVSFSPKKYLKTWNFQMGTKKKGMSFQQRYSSAVISIRRFGTGQARLARTTGTSQCERLSLKRLLHVCCCD